MASDSEWGERTGTEAKQKLTEQRKGKLESKIGSSPIVTRSYKDQQEYQREALTMADLGYKVVAVTADPQSKKRLLVTYSNQ